MYHLTAGYFAMPFLRGFHKAGKQPVFKKQAVGWPLTLLVFCITIFNNNYISNLRQVQSSLSLGESAFTSAHAIPTQLSAKPQKYSLEYHGLIQLKIVVFQDPDALLLPDLFISTDLHANAH